MSVKPILFNTAMVKAILDGQKTVTRRIIKPQPTLNNGFWELDGAGWGDNVKSFHPVPCHSLYNRMPYQPGDILYVRETWTMEEFYDNGAMIKYRAGGELPIDYDTEGETYYKLLKFADDGWVPSIHMPKEAARIWLRVTDVRVERLRDIVVKNPQQTIHNICSEGIEFKAVMENFEVLINDFKTLWDSTIKKPDFERYGWEANPWVWVIEFERCEKPESEGTDESQGS
jgi:hypothetical protein